MLKLDDRGSRRVTESRLLSVTTDSRSLPTRGVMSRSNKLCRLCESGSESASGRMSCEVLGVCQGDGRCTDCPMRVSGG